MTYARRPYPKYVRPRRRSRPSNGRIRRSRSTVVRTKRQPAFKRARYPTLRQPFPNITKRVLTYAFRDQISPPPTSAGGFSVGVISYQVNYPYDIDPTSATIQSSARRNHQPMGYDQLELLYNQHRVDWVKMKISFSVEKPQLQIQETITPVGSGVSQVVGSHQTSVPIRVAILATKDPTLDQSLLVTTPGTVAFEKIIEQSRSGMLPRGTALVYRTMTHDKVVSLKRSMNMFKFFKLSDAKSWSDWTEDNTKGFNQQPVDRIYFHIIASPISVTPGDQHPKVTFYGDMQLGMTFSDLKQFGQS